MGPSNPLYLKPTGYKATMVGLPYDDLKAWQSIYPTEVWISQMAKVRDGFASGCGLWSQIIPKTSGTLQHDVQLELGLFRTVELHFGSCANQARFVAARDKLLAATEETTRAACRAELRKITQDELATVKQLLPLARADSRIGYESSNHYFYIPQDLLEKVLCCRNILSELEK